MTVLVRLLAMLLVLGMVCAPVIASAASAATAPTCCAGKAKPHRSRLMPHR